MAAVASDVRFSLVDRARKEPFSTPHTITVLLLFAAFIVYAAFGGVGTADGTTNIRYGLCAAVAIALVFSAEHLRDTLFIRPHPAFWRLVTGVGLLYAMSFAFLLFQDIRTIRTVILPLLDPIGTGTPLKQKTYGEACDVWPPAVGYENVRAGLDVFVIAHFFGWIAKHMMLRDIKLSMTLSFLFELMEYSFEFLQPNFKECWWDHWILDFALCNTGGIIVGELLLQWFKSKSYDWAGYSTVTVKGKLIRALAQFTPASWTPWDWSVLHSFPRFCAVLTVCVGAMVIELDAFFLKDIFWLEPPHRLNLIRLAIWCFVGMAGLRDYFSYMTDRRVQRIGSCCWIMLAMMILELLVVIRFGVSHFAPKAEPIPARVVFVWAFAALLFAGWTLYWFMLRSREGAGRASSGTAAAAAAPVAAVAAAEAPEANEEEEGKEEAAELAAEAEAAGAEPAALAAEKEPEEEEAAAPVRKRKGGRKSTTEVSKLLQFDMRFGSSLASTASSSTGGRRGRLL